MQLHHIPLPHIQLPCISRRQAVNAALGGIAWALLGIGLAKMFGGDLGSQILVAVCDSTAGALVWLATFDPSPKAKRSHLRVPDEKKLFGFLKRRRV
jgi:hypothetical protein